jgi:hypothetical protein
LDRLELVWSRFARFWLPAEKATGNIEDDVAETLRITYKSKLDPAKDARFNAKSGTGVVAITDEHTIVACNPVPALNLPSWVNQRSHLEARQTRNEAVIDLLRSGKRHIILEMGNQMIAPADIIEGGEGVVVICKPGETITISNRRVTEVRKALELLGAKSRADKLRRAVERREIQGPSPAIDDEIRSIAMKAKISLPELFDAAEALQRATPEERKFAA